MPSHLTRRRLLLAGLAASLQWPAFVRAQAYPSRPIKLVVPFPPGGATDVMARTLGERLQARLGQPVVIDNRPGGGTLIGADAVAKAPADGYTLLLSGSSTFSVAPALRTSMPYDARADLALLTIVAKAPLVLVTGPGTTARTLAELIAQGKSKPGSLSYATFGPGSAPHLLGEMFAFEAGISLLAVPYRGSAAAATAVLSGEIGMAFDTVASAGAHIKAGKLRALAVVDDQRLPALPEVPTMAELRLPKVAFSAWYGLAAPAGTPPAVQQQLAREVAAVLALPEVRERLNSAHLQPYLLDSAAFAAKVREEIAVYSALGKRANIVME